MCIDAVQHIVLEYVWGVAQDLRRLDPGFYDSDGFLRCLLVWHVICFIRHIEYS